jgi:hypothetical protein
MSHELADARLLTVDGYGHTALVNPSSCVAAAKDSYFVTGTLPRPAPCATRTRSRSPADAGPPLSKRVKRAGVRRRCRFCRFS